MRKRTGFLKDDHPLDMGEPLPPSPRERLAARAQMRRRPPDRSWTPIQVVLGRDCEHRPWLKAPDAPLLRAPAVWFRYRHRFDADYAGIFDEALKASLLDATTRLAAGRRSLRSTKSCWQELAIPRQQRHVVMNPLHAPSFTVQWNRMMRTLIEEEIED